MANAEMWCDCCGARITGEYCFAWISGPKHIGDLEIDSETARRYRLCPECRKKIGSGKNREPGRE